MIKKYRFSCPHCGKEQIKEFKGGNLGHCHDCKKPYGFLMTSGYDMHVFLLHKAERIEGRRED